jgi:hypothetical protein
MRFSWLDNEKLQIINMKVNKKRILLFFIVLFLLAGAFGWHVIAKQHYKKYYANIDENHQWLDAFVEDSTAFVRTAFPQLEKKFSNANDLRIDGFRIRPRDTFVNGVLDTVYSVYFTYFINNVNSGKFLSKFIVFNDTATLEYFNKRMKEDKEIFESDSSDLEVARETIHDAKHLLDSLKQR